MAANHRSGLRRLAEAGKILVAGIILTVYFVGWELVPWMRRRRSKW